MPYDYGIIHNDMYKESASQTSVCACVACIPAEYNILPTSLLTLCPAEIDRLHHLAKKTGRKNISSGRFCLFSLSIRLDESSNKKNELGNSGQIRCPCARFTAALVSKGTHSRKHNFSEHFSKRTSKQ